MSLQNLAPVSIPTSATQIVAANANRNSLALFMPVSNSDTVYLGVDNTVTGDQTATGGVPRKPGESITYTDQDAAHAIWGIAASGTQIVNGQLHTVP